MSTMQIEWTVLKHYDKDHLSRIALPIGGIGTGTVSIGGRGNLHSWEIMNRPAKGFVPRGVGHDCFPSMVLSVDDGGERTTRLMEGPLNHWEYEGCIGASTPNHGMPRFSDCSFDASYPFGCVNLSDPGVPLNVSIESFNPFIPCDSDRSGIPTAIFRVVLSNSTDRELDASVCFNMPNYIGLDTPDAKCENQKNVNTYQSQDGVQGLFMQSGGVDLESPAWGTMALTTTAAKGISYRTAWRKAAWGTSLLDYWDEFSTIGVLSEREHDDISIPMGSLAVRQNVPANGSAEVTFLLSWHFPNRNTWTPIKIEENNNKTESSLPNPNIIGNYYCTQYSDAWDVAKKVFSELDVLKADTISFVNAFLASDVPDVVKEAALFNLSTLRTQTSFRTRDGRFYGWEGCGDSYGSCHGSCTHVWNYETSTAFLFGDLARSMREIEFMHATNDDGFMCFRVNLPLEHASEFGCAAADGQMGCILKAYREWQLSGNEDDLRTMWPRIRSSLEFCWIPNGWDADCDGVMEGCQHNTMDVEYHGPNPQMQGWYLGALRAAEIMARHLGEDDFATKCYKLFEYGSAWMDDNLFNGEYYIHDIRMPGNDAKIAKGLILGMSGKDLSTPDYQLGEGSLVDQLVGQYMAHICGLGYLHNTANVKNTLQSILRYNRLDKFNAHFNCMRSYVLGDETALLMAAYPHSRPDNPFPYFTEVMTGFEYTAAIGMLYEGMIDEGLDCIRAIRERYDGSKRNPFDEAECGHHYARAMAAWSAIPALTGFQYSAVDRTIRFAAPDQEVNWFWASGHAWGTVNIRPVGEDYDVRLDVMGGELNADRVLIGSSTNKTGFKQKTEINNL